MALLRSDGARRRASFIYGNTLVLYLETNDLDSSAGNKTAAQVAAYYSAEAADFRAAWAAVNPLLPCFVLVCTPLPRGADGGTPSTTQQRIADFDALVRAGISGTDGYWDLNSLYAVPGTPWKIADTALFNGDLLHLAPAGHAVGSGYISNMIQQPVPYLIL